MKITIKCSSPCYCNHSDTVTASKHSQDTVPVLWNWDFLLKKRATTKKNKSVFPSSNTNKSSASDSRLNPFSRLNACKSIQHLVAGLLSPNLALKYTLSYAHNVLLQRSRSKIICPEAAASVCSGEHSFPMPLLPQHAHTHTCAPRCFSAHHHKPPSASGFQGPDAADQFSWTCVTAGNLTLFPNSEPKGIATLELSMR